MTFTYFLNDLIKQMRSQTTHWYLFNAHIYETTTIIYTVHYTPSLTAVNMT